MKLPKITLHARRDGGIFREEGISVRGNVSENCSDESMQKRFLIVSWGQHPPNEKSNCRNILYWLVLSCVTFFSPKYRFVKNIFFSPTYINCWFINLNLMNRNEVTQNFLLHACSNGRGKDIFRRGIFWKRRNLEHIKQYFGWLLNEQKLPTSLRVRHSFFLW